MIITYEKIESLADINFDYLFSRSYDQLAVNFPWPEFMIGYPERHYFYRSQLELAVNGMWAGRNPEDTFIMFKTVVDGEDLELTAGYIDNTGCFFGVWYLTARGPGNSRNWIYSAEAKATRQAFHLAQGILTHKIITHTTSSLYRALKLRSNTGNFTILDEYPAVSGDNPKNLVTLIVQM